MNPRPPRQPDPDLITQLEGDYELTWRDWVLPVILVLCVIAGALIDGSL